MSSDGWSCGVSPSARLDAGRHIRVFSSLGAAWCFAGSLVWFLGVVGPWWRCYSGGGFSTARVKMARPLEELRPDTVDVLRLPPICVVTVMAAPLLAIPGVAPVGVILCGCVVSFV